MSVNGGFAPALVPPRSLAGAASPAGAYVWSVTVWGGITRGGVGCPDWICTTICSTAYEPLIPSFDLSGTLLQWIGTTAFVSVTTSFALLIAHDYLPLEDADEESIVFLGAGIAGGVATATVTALLEAAAFGLPHPNGDLGLWATRASLSSAIWFAVIHSVWLVRPLTAVSIGLFTLPVAGVAGLLLAVAVIS